MFQDPGPGFWPIWVRLALLVGVFAFKIVGVCRMVWDVYYRGAVWNGEERNFAVLQRTPRIYVLNIKLMLLYINKLHLLGRESRSFFRIRKKSQRYIEHTMKKRSVGCKIDLADRSHPAKNKTKRCK
eukprot:GEMP01103844.1.p1 GENE.GEMP01103844.1~~GEMP01103844.1.p1  ORF type:complete len:127 (-),score=3.37 GEMP01103844.1:292-672(-)